MTATGVVAAMAGPEPGWYTSADESGTAKYWDGSAWTGEFRPIGEAPDPSPLPEAAPALPPAPPGRLLGPVLGLVALFVLAAVVAGLITVLTRNGDSHPSVLTASTPETASTAASSLVSTTRAPTTTTADATVAYKALLSQIAAVIDTSAPARDELQGILTEASNCTLPVGTGSALLTSVVANRTAAVAQVARLTAPAGAGHAAELLATLKRALQQSLADDDAYARWIDTRGRSGCPVGSPPDTASTASFKQEVLDLYNGDASGYGLAPETRIGF